MRFTNIMPCRTTASALSMDLYSAGTLITFVVHGLIIYSPKRQEKGGKFVKPFHSGISVSH